MGLQVNRKVVKRLLREYIFVMVLISCMISNLLWALLLFDIRSAIVVCCMPGFMMIPFTDAIPKNLRWNVLIHSLLALVWGSYSFVSLTDLHDSPLNLKIPIPFTKANITFVGTSAGLLSQYLILTLNILYHMCVSPDALSVLRAQLASCKMPASEANKLINVGQERNIFERLPELCQKLVDHASGKQTKHVWEVLEMNKEYTLSHKKIESSKKGQVNMTACKIEFLLENVNLMDIKKWLLDAVAGEGDYKWPGGAKYEEINTPRGLEIRNHRIGYRVFELPVVSNRLMHFEESFCLLEDQGLLVNSLQSTSKSIGFVPNKIKESTAVADLVVGGMVCERVGKNITKVTYCYAGTLGGWVSQKIADMVTHGEMKRHHGQYAKDFNLEKTFNPLMLNIEKAECSLFNASEDFHANVNIALEKHYPTEASQNLLFASLLKRDLRMYRRTNKTDFDTKNPFDVNNIKGYFEHLKNEIVVNATPNDNDIVDNDMIDGDGKIDSDDKTETMNDGDAIPNDNTGSNSDDKSFKIKSLIHNRATVRLRKRYSAIETKTRCQTKRVIFPYHKPFEVFTKDTIGTKIFGGQVSGVINFLVSNRFLGLMWVLLMYGSLFIGICAIFKFINPYFGSIMIVCWTFYTFLLICNINVKVVRLLFSNFLVWYPVMSFLIANIGWAILLNDFRSVMILCIAPFATSSLYCDAFPKTFRSSTFGDILGCFIWTISALFSISLNASSKANYHFNLPWSKKSQTLSLTAIISSLMWQVLTIYSKILFQLIFHPETLCVLRADLQSRRLLQNAANKIMSTVVKNRAFKQLTVAGQKLAAHVTGASSAVPWEIVKTNPSFMISFMAPSTRVDSLFKFGSYKVILLSFQYFNFNKNSPFHRSFSAWRK